MAFFTKSLKNTSNRWSYSWNIFKNKRIYFSLKEGLVFNLFSFLVLLVGIALVITTLPGFFHLTGNIPANASEEQIAALKALWEKNMFTYIWSVRGIAIFLFALSFGLNLFNLNQINKKVKKSLIWFDVENNERYGLFVFVSFLLSFFAPLQYFWNLYHFQKKMHFRSFYDFENNLISLEDQKLSLFEKFSFYLKSPYFKSLFRFSVFDISIAAVLLGTFLIVSFITSFSALKLTGINLEYIFYITFAFVLRWFKGSILALLADFLNLLIKGAIGTYHWVYAIVPVFVVLISSAFFYFLEKWKKTTIVVGNVFLLGALIAVIAVFSYQVGIKQVSEIRISTLFGIRNVSITIIIVFIVLSGIVFLTSLGISIYYLYISVKKDEDFKLDRKKDFAFRLIISFIIVTIIVVVARWLWGPYAYIRWFSWINGKPPRNPYELAIIPILLRSVFIIPFYTFLVVALMAPFFVLKKKYLDAKMHHLY